MSQMCPSNSLSSPSTWNQCLKWLSTAQGQEAHHLWHTEDHRSPTCEKTPVSFLIHNFLRASSEGKSKSGVSIMISSGRAAERPLRSVGNLYYWQAMNSVCHAVIVVLWVENTEEKKKHCTWKRPFHHLPCLKASWSIEWRGWWHLWHC